MRTRERLRTAVLVTAAVAALVPFGGGASAVPSEATLRVEKQGWYWRQAQRVEAEPPACPDPSTGVPCPNVTQQPSAIEPDHFAVGFSDVGDDDPATRADERWQSVAAFQFDLLWLRAGTKVLSAALELEESNDDATHPNRRPSGNVASDAPGTRLRACLVGEFWGPSQPGLWEELPEVHCDVAQGAGTREEVSFEGRTLPVWRFDLTSIAKVWGANPSSNFGVAIVPDQRATGEFEVSFHGDTRVVTADPVTRIEQVESVVRVRAAMRFEAAPVAPPPGRGTPDAGASASEAESAASVFGSDVVSFAPRAGTAGGEPSRTVTLRRSPRLLARSATVPAYTWAGLPVMLVVVRLVWLLFSTHRTAREHRVAAVWRSARTAGGVT